MNSRGFLVGKAFYIHTYFLLQVIMATKEAAERACKEPNPIIDGRKANVNLAILGAKPRLNSLQGKLIIP